MNTMGKLVFAVNRERFELAEVDPSTTLLEFLRTRARFTGPKLGCGEGKNFHVNSSNVPSNAKYPDDCTNGYAGTLPHRGSNFQQLNSPNVILPSEQLIEFSKDYYPVGEPIKKVGAEIQASGEAIYVDDIPSPKDCLHGAFVYSKRPLAHIKGITFNSTTASKKIIKFISTNDIPKGGKNLGCMFWFGSDPLFADTLTEWAGQPLGIVVAETQRYANMAAKQANVQYSTENLEPPILSVEDAVRRSSFFDIPPPTFDLKVGDQPKGMAEADHKILSAELWDNGGENLLDRVRVIQADTFSLVQGGFTGGSTTSESSCEAVRLSCSVLVSRLKSLKQRLEEQMGPISWATLISQANMQAVNLSASTYWVPDASSKEYLNYGAAISEVEVDILTGATTILRTDLIYDCGQSLNPAVDIGQIEGAFVQGIGFFMYEEVVQNSDGLVVSDGTWTYKIPTVDTIPKQFNVKLLKSGHHEKRVLSSKASGEPPLLLAASVHCATREAIRAARAEFLSTTDDPNSAVSSFQFDVPATMPKVKELCGLNNVEKYLETFASTHQQVEA
ncbi:indole-3-acetaldehyde oxidase-like isoform X4 [Canna indica]|uniref:Indole-3-acetaldehyde oxidase-like isoform X4 n=1 Tax=Canna indica TaxID=4628 RepID=A0AAQ3KZK3_9LILI|nr:indole-3-acetaldehyde oxidase-like isoform X4 [Canna indica]